MTLIINMMEYPHDYQPHYFIAANYLSLSAPKRPKAPKVENTNQLSRLSEPEIISNTRTHNTQNDENNMAMRDERKLSMSQNHQRR